VRDPYRLILWEQVAYLTGDAQRAKAFAELERRVGLAPHEILAAPITTLREIVRVGGSIGVPQRAARLHEVAERTLGEWDGDLDAVLELPFPQARRALTRFPSIGEPGAEKILLLAGAYPVLALESNGLRVLRRLGYGRDLKSYQQTYRLVQGLAEKELRRSVPVRREAFGLLRQHGQTLCKNSAPRCGGCPLVIHCPTGRARAT
jgi:endonuclease III